MKKLIFLMVFVLFLGVALWANSSYDIKNSFNISAGITSLALVTYYAATLLFAVMAVFISWMYENGSLKFFCGALYFSVMSYIASFFIKKLNMDIIISGFLFSNLLSVGFSVMAGVLLVFGVYFSISNRQFN
ncbi:hypothetical protein [Pantoea sp. CFSAN033090]|uniref:hypothetical protein n=1 Tax=Pantoea sp. CFSAN033090 TaxID=1690502 RepID=UPI00068EB8F4|nr:hypothetical protein [Pantoea sp. CFSAN033090]KOA68689.1 hypothetical protein AFL22_19770 [Pantoea sp. CFSAN033090]